MIAIGPPSAPLSHKSVSPDKGGGWKIPLHPILKYPAQGQAASASFELSEGPLLKTEAAETNFFRV